MPSSLDISVIESNNTKSISILDLSMYLGIPANPKLTILLPGFTTAIELNFLPNRINTYNSNNLNLSDVSSIEELKELPDGIYKITYTIGTTNKITIVRNYLRTERLQNNFNSVLLKLDLYNCENTKKKDYINKLKEIEFLLASAKANANKCNLKVAIDIYQYSQNLIKKLEQDC